VRDRDESAPVLAGETQQGSIARAPGARLDAALLVYMYGLDTQPQLQRGSQGLRRLTVEGRRRAKTVIDMCQDE
jgi:hypothetical protein